MSNKGNYNRIQRSLWGLMGISDSVYVFLSGILISLFANLLTTLCFEPVEFSKEWCVIVTIITSAISGTLCMVIAVKLGPIQTTLKSDLETFRKQDERDGDFLQKERRKKSFASSTKNNLKRWMLVYFLFITSFIASIIFMILKFTLFK